MARLRGLDRWFGPAMALLLLLCLEQLWWGGPGGVVPERLSTAVPALLKLLFLALGTFYAWRASVALGSGNPVRLAWRLLALGLGLYFAGQSCLGWYQLVLATSAPFPSVADPFFLLSLGGLGAALVAFVVAYRRSGFPGTSGKELLGGGSVAAVVIGVLTWILLLPVLREPTPGLERLFNVAYPILDAVMLTLAVVLWRVTLKLRGGSLWAVWMLILLGFFFVAAGDIAFAYFTSLDLPALEPVLDLIFAYAYVFFAWGTRRQYEIVG